MQELMQAEALRLQMGPLLMPELPSAVLGAGTTTFGLLGITGAHDLSIGAISH